MVEVFKAILDHRARSEDRVLVSAVGAQRSAPRKAQSHMLVDRLGRVCGTVGGGAVEGNSIAHAMKLLAQGIAHTAVGTGDHYRFHRIHADQRSCRHHSIAFVNSFWNCLFSHTSMV